MQVTCPACQKTLQSKGDLSGKTVKCPCGNSFAVPKAAPTAALPAAAPAQAAAAKTAVTQPAVATAQAGKIAVRCNCGKTLQAPAAAAGKAVKCPCGQVVKVPAATPATAQRAAPARPVPQMAAVGAAPANPGVGGMANNPYAAPNPFGDISDDEWQSMVKATAPKQVDQSKPKEKSAAAKMLEEARKETGQGNVLAMDAAKGFLNKTRGILVFLGLLCVVRAVVAWWLLTSLIDAMSAGDPDEASIVKVVVTVFCGIDLGIGVLYIVAGFLVSILPLTCTITALVVFSLVEIANFIFDPTSLLSIRGWAFRIAIFGGLVQGINNAAYYRHIKAEEREAKKQRGG